MFVLAEGGVDGWLLALAVLGCILTLIAMVGGGVWIVAQIKGTNSVLITNLNRVGATVEAIGNKVASHGERIVRVEERLKIQH